MLNVKVITLKNKFVWLLLILIGNKILNNENQFNYILIIFNELCNTFPNKISKFHLTIYTSLTE